MSLLSKIAKSVLSVPGAGAVIGGFLGGPPGAMLGTQLQGIYTATEASRASVAGSTVQTMGALPSLPAIGGAVMAGGRLVVGGARAIARSANIYCRRHPAWCASIGGIGAVAGMIEGGQLPTIKRRRARGISATEFRGFRKVHRVLSGFCAPRMKIRRKGARAC